MNNQEQKTVKIKEEAPEQEIETEIKKSPCPPGYSPDGNGGCVKDPGK